ncbi:hypothetical protein GXW83_25605 [Streptacidiphilus sp. PB12-B1b]|uniref:hypothetical protein n=1 Tax=Streptacidiphilus sp. PB12-B1b TaxID=2705012 RepID=UPI0015FC0756|nr:hypothetical protein [Streptacidiphilus sp. PB12-B1b]QMU78580.1 hypothetical protein GXW83_25605 [Streptacidiphilus sp. PB12-B1b]
MTGGGDGDRDAAEHACGYCHVCSQYTARGRVVGSVDQGSGPGYLVLACAVCDRLTPAAARARARRR